MMGQPAVPHSAPFSVCAYTLVFQAGYKISHNLIGQDETKTNEYYDYICDFDHIDVHCNVHNMMSKNQYLISSMCIVWHVCFIISGYKGLVTMWKFLALRYQLCRQLRWTNSIITKKMILFLLRN